MIQADAWCEDTCADNLGFQIMNPPSAFSPLIVHIPHAVPVVIIWGIMLRFYLVQRKLKRDGNQPSREETVAVEGSVPAAADRPSVGRFRAVDDASGLAAQVGGRERPVSVGRTPTPGLE
jgi:hypothetical protein